MSGVRRFVTPLLREHRRELVLLAGCAAVEALPVLLSGQLVAAALDRGFLAGSPASGVAFLAVQACVAVVGALAGRQAVRPTAVLVEGLRDRVVESAVHGALVAAVSSDRPGGAGGAARVTRQVETVRVLAGSLLVVARTVLFSLAAAVAGLAMLVPVALVVTVPCLVLGAVALVPVTRVWKARYEEALTVEERLAEGVGRTLEGLRDVVACGATGRAAAEVDDLLRAQVVARGRVATAAAGRIGAFAVPARLPLLALLLGSPLLLSSGAVTPGTLVGAATYLVVTVEPVTRTIVEAVGNLGLEFAAVLGRIAAHDRPVPPGRERGPGGDLVLTDVGFRHGPHAQPVVDGLSVRVAAGEHVAVVGPTGTGKSSLAELVAGLLPPSRGRITLAGGSVSPVLLVPQDPYVVAGTVRENLTYLRPTANEADIVSAAHAIGSSDLLTRLGGLDAAVPDTLSAGERQLLVATRAYLADAPCTVLDEATCHLDPDAEARVERAFSARATTLVVIAHRPASPLRADRVLYLDGPATAIGTHDDLRADSPAYRRFTDHWRTASDPLVEHADRAR